MNNDSGGLADEWMYEWCSAETVKRFCIKHDYSWRNSVKKHKHINHLDIKESGIIFEKF